MTSDTHKLRFIFQACHRSIFCPYLPLFKRVKSLWPWFRRSCTTRRTKSATTVAGSPVGGAERNSGARWCLEIRTYGWKHRGTGGKSSTIGSLSAKIIYKVLSVGKPGYVETGNGSWIFPIKLRIYWGHAGILFCCLLKVWLHQIAESWTLHDMGDTKHFEKHLQKVSNLKVDK